MSGKRTKQRVSSKIDELPDGLRMQVDVMLADTSNTYAYISSFLKKKDMTYQSPVSADTPRGRTGRCRGCLKRRHRRTG